MGISLTSCQFENDSNTYYIIGTAYVLEDEQEPTRGRRKISQNREQYYKVAVILIFAFDSSLFQPHKQCYQTFVYLQYL